MRRSGADCGNRVIAAQSQVFKEIPSILAVVRETATFEMNGHFLFFFVNSELNYPVAAATVCVTTRLSP